MKAPLHSVYLEKPLLDLEGNEKLRLENYKEILDLAENIIKISAGSGVYEITGDRLWVKAVSKREIFVEGIIRNIQISYAAGSQTESEQRV